MNSNITPDGGNFTVLELVEKYISQKTGVCHNTRSNYNFVVNVIKKEAFGQKRIDKIKVSDAKEWLIKMQQIDGRGYSSIHTIRGVVRPAFQMAVDDDLLVKNPFEIQLNTYTHLNYDDAEEEMQKVVGVASKKSTTHRKRCVS